MLGFLYELHRLVRPNLYRFIFKVYDKTLSMCLKIGFVFVQMKIKGWGAFNLLPILTFLDAQIPLILLGIVNHLQAIYHGMGLYLMLPCLIKGKVIKHINRNRISILIDADGYQVIKSANDIGIRKQSF